MEQALGKLVLRIYNFFLEKIMTSRTYLQKFIPSKT